MRVIKHGLPPQRVANAIMGRVEDRQMTSGPAFLGELRDRLLDQVLGLLKADPVVGGVALIGSLCHGAADNWSDIDLLIFMGDRAIARFADEPAARPWAQADLLSDGRHNSPAGATSVGATHLRSGLPLRVDLHVHPKPGRIGRLTAASSSSVGNRGGSFVGEGPAPCGLPAAASADSRRSRGGSGRGEQTLKVFVARSAGLVLHI